MDTYCMHLKTVLFTDSWGCGAFVTFWYYCAVYKCSYLLTYVLTVIVAQSKNKLVAWRFRPLFSYFCWPPVEPRLVLIGSAEPPAENHWSITCQNNSIVFFLYKSWPSWKLIQSPSGVSTTFSTVMAVKFGAKNLPTVLRELKRTVKNYCERWRGLAGFLSNASYRHNWSAVTRLLVLYIWLPPCGQNISGAWKAGSGRSADPPP